MVDLIHCKDLNLTSFNSRPFVGNRLHSGIKVTETILLIAPIFWIVSMSKILGLILSLKFEGQVKFYFRISKNSTLDRF